MKLIDAELLNRTSAQARTDDRLRKNYNFHERPDDPVNRRRQFWELIYDASERGITVFVTTHYMDEAEYCNRVSIMVDGAIRALDTPANLKRTFDAPNMDEVFHRLAREAKRGE